MQTDDQRRPAEERTEEEWAELARCPNCGCIRASQFCPDCGQKEQPLRASTLYFIRNAVNDYFGLDGRLWLTLRVFLFKPGELTRENIRGRRARYVAPLRLYLSASVLFFFLISVLDPVGALEDRLGGPVGQDSTVTVTERLAQLNRLTERQSERVAESQMALTEARGRVDSLRSVAGADSARGVRLDSLRSGMRIAEIARAEARVTTLEARVLGRTRQAALEQRRAAFQESVLATYPADSLIRLADLTDAAALVHPDPDGMIDDGIDINFLGAEEDNPFLQRIRNARTTAERSQAVADFTRSVISRVPVALFLLLPVFALLMKLIYIRRDWYYSEHLIFALHNHAFAFFVFTLIALLIQFGGGARWVDITNAVLTIGISIYFLLAQKRVYGQGWRKSIFKWALVFLIYGFNALFFGIIIALILAALLG